MWTQECEERFQSLKHLLTHAPVLKIIDPENDFLMCTYAYKEGLGGVLMQGGSVVCYESRKLNENEVNYVTHDLELVARSVPQIYAALDNNQVDHQASVVEI